MRVNRILLIPGRQTPVLGPPIAQPLHALAETVEGPLTGPGPMCMLLPRHGDADPVAAQVRPLLATAVEALAPPDDTAGVWGAPTICIKLMGIRDGKFGYF